MTKGEALSLGLEIKRILYGIQLTESQDANGWWETSEGAERGRQKLCDIMDLLNDMSKE